MHCYRKKRTVKNYYRISNGPIGRWTTNMKPGVKASKDADTQKHTCEILLKKTVKTLGASIQFIMFRHTRTITRI